jgi:hypothetical protein
MIAQQGAWYLEPGFPRLAAQMFDASIDMLRSLGVKMIFPHHRTQGAGTASGGSSAAAGPSTSRTPTLWIGTD